MPDVACVDYATMIQPLLSASCAGSGCHAGAAAARFLDAGDLAAVRAGGSLRSSIVACNWAGSTLAHKLSGAWCGDRMPLDGPPWVSGSELAILKAWVDGGARATCDDPDPCADTTRPQFGGANSATAKGATTAEVCWDAATDGTAPTEDLVYEVWDSIGSDGQRLNALAGYAASGGATCLTGPAPPGLRGSARIGAGQIARSVVPASRVGRPETESYPKVCRRFSGGRAGRRGGR